MVVDKKNMFDKSREHLANERTFLAWIRTSIALMGFGFVIVKFVLFLKEISIYLKIEQSVTSGYSAIVGIVMVLIGVTIALLAYFQYRSKEKQINNSEFKSSPLLILLITLILLVGGIVLISYLLTVI